MGRTSEDCGEQVVKGGAAEALGRSGQVGAADVAGAGDEMPLQRLPNTITQVGTFGECKSDHNAAEVIVARRREARAEAHQRDEAVSLDVGDCSGA